MLPLSLSSLEQKCHHQGLENPDRERGQQARLLPVSHSSYPGQGKGSGLCCREALQLSQPLHLLFAPCAFQSCLVFNLYQLFFFFFNYSQVTSRRF